MMIKCAQESCILLKAVKLARVNEAQPSIPNMVLSLVLDIIAHMCWCYHQVTDCSDHG